MGSQHGYDLSAVNETTNVPSKRKADNVEVAIDPSELEKGLDESTLRAKYDAERKSKMSVGANDEDLSDMYAEYASKQAKKLKTQKR
ncbi:hypothetical protein G6F68_020801 [Rhizopus microsporus]|nr:hypothetical protein G6F68_020801 [Rhizopus microsporus]